MLKTDLPLNLSEMTPFADPIILSVILDERNRHITDAIVDSKDSKIYALYGAFHFEGVFQHLKSHNPKWRIIKIESIKPY